MKEKYTINHILIDRHKSIEYTYKRNVLFGYFYYFNKPI